MFSGIFRVLVCKIHLSECRHSRKKKLSCAGDNKGAFTCVFTSQNTKDVAWRNLVFKSSLKSATVAMESIISSLYSHMNIEWK